MPPDSSETRRRILTAAYEEFSRFGLAGARVDRIAENAQANKRSLYVHFGPKEHLFDLVVVDALTRMATAVPFTADDLRGYAGRLFDYLHENPGTLRLSTWANLERPNASDAEGDAYRPKVEALRARFGDDSVDVLAFVLAIVTAWANASPALTSLREGATGEDEEARSRHRALVVDAIAALATRFGS